MIRFAQILGVVALLLFSYAQWQGWSLDRPTGNSGSNFTRSNYHK